MAQAPEQQAFLGGAAPDVINHLAGLRAGSLVAALRGERPEVVRAAGLTDLEILDVTHASAMFAWANRLMQTLGKGEPQADAPA